MGFKQVPLPGGDLEFSFAGIVSESISVLENIRYRTAEDSFVSPSISQATDRTIKALYNLKREDSKPHNDATQDFIESVKSITSKMRDVAVNHDIYGFEPDCVVDAYVGKLQSTLTCLLQGEESVETAQFEFKRAKNIRERAWQHLGGPTGCSGQTESDEPHTSVQTGCKSFYWPDHRIVLHTFADLESLIGENSTGSRFRQVYKWAKKRGGMDSEQRSQAVQTLEAEESSNALASLDPAVAVYQGHLMTSAKAALSGDTETTVASRRLAVASRTEVAR